MIYRDPIAEDDIGLFWVGSICGYGYLDSHQLGRIVPLSNEWFHFLDSDPFY